MTLEELRVVSDVGIGKVPDSKRTKKELTLNWRLNSRGNDKCCNNFFVCIGIKYFVTDQQKIKKRRHEHFFKKLGIFIFPRCQGKIRLYAYISHYFLK
jgi:hypothetical protein